VLVVDEHVIAGMSRQHDSPKANQNSKKKRLVNCADTPMRSCTLVLRVLIFSTSRFNIFVSIQT
jgi:hypothetical protein